MRYAVFPTCPGSGVELPQRGTRSIAPQGRDGTYGQGEKRQFVPVAAEHPRAMLPVSVTHC
jgi:hypothetical protein